MELRLIKLSHQAIAEAMALPVTVTGYGDLRQEDDFNSQKKDYGAQPSLSQQFTRGSRRKGFL